MLKNNNFMKNCIFFSDLIKNKKKILPIKKKYPKVGDRIWIKYIYVQGTKLIRFYSKIFYGRCIGLKRKNSNNSLIILRNVYNRDPLEMGFFLHSPFILNYNIKNKSFDFRKLKLYFLRNKKIARSKV
jgi:ribosomal protein L19